MITLFTDAITFSLLKLPPSRGGLRLTLPFELTGKRLEGWHG